MKRILFAIAAPVALATAPAPALAQDSAGDAEMQQLSAMFSQMFTAEPLTAEQEARLPLATELVVQVMPEGFYGRMMEDMLGGILDPLMSMMPETMPAGEIAAYLGQPVDVVEAMDEGERQAIAAMIDPQYGARLDAGMDYMMGELVKQLVAFEPYMRDGLSRAYAARFTQPQLEDIAAFFATETGSLYATESMMVFTDPQVMSASMQAMPMMLEDMPRIMGEMEQMMSAAGQARGFGDLSQQERERIANALSISVAELRKGMEQASAK
ncbi:DUF2059 domain-containing protein [Alteraurantiacibacter aquimixticola]|uniref:DUF2059 domain-containing protein n=1 Tax=Alteraurantiacibacter aquimixticola TaxID=2489173 RepID=A0A4T3F3L2_9SPHN|nr:DUF2059 domain-containing protein [Alteraurantiacibacter aquimixticola]TIX49240.1 DUF2059 domain-containing protein [Alteraurantiacibacter aquimixticola]